MIFTRQSPTPALRDIVESIWIQDSGSCDAPRKPGCVLPTGTVEILFHYGDRFSHVVDRRVEPVPRFYVTGQRSRPVFTLAPQRFGIVIASLYPWGARALFPETCETTDGYTDLSQLTGRARLGRLEERLFAATEARSRVGLVESFLLEQRRRDEIDRRMIAASRLLASGREELPVTQAAQRLAMSRRHFARTFRSTIGIQPKTFSRIMRFQRALRIHRRGSLPLAAIAAECGYTDQAHMSHEVRRFSAHTARAIDPGGDVAGQVFNGETVSRFFNTVYL